MLRLYKYVELNSSSTDAIIYPSPLFVMCFQQKPDCCSICILIIKQWTRISRRLLNTARTRRRRKNKHEVGYGTRLYRFTSISCALVVEARIWLWLVRLCFLYGCVDLYAPASPQPPCAARTVHNWRLRSGSPRVDRRRVRQPSGSPRGALLTAGSSRALTGSSADISHSSPTHHTGG